MERTVRIELGDRSYDVRIVGGLLEALGAAAAAMENVHQAAVICDSNVAPLYGDRAVGSLEAAGVSAALIPFDSGEANKNLKTFAALMDSLLAIEPAIDRNTVVVAVGGGVTSDLAGYVAASALRGLRWLCCPTTLLADVDASVGGKTGVNHKTIGKNLIGAFHQPSGVLIDVETLKTQPDDVMKCGLAECVKHGVIREAGLLDFIEDNAEAILARDTEVTSDLIARNVAIKAAVVADDEREVGRRAHLNFGHTIGHVIETLAGYGKTVRHGHAVALGMVAACHMSVKRGLIEADAAARVRRLLERLGLPVRRKGLDAGEVWRIMQHDKKARRGRVQMILPTMLGQVDIFDDITPAAVDEAVEALATE